MRAPLRSTRFSSCTRLTSVTAKSASLSTTPSRTAMRSVARVTGTATMRPSRRRSSSGMTMTPSRTVAICGRCSGLTMVAMMLPPNAGRIW